MTQNMEDFSFNNPEQAEFLKAQQEGKSIFLTGKAGTGKTTLLRYLINTLRNQNKKVVVVAPTGIAALQAGGVTIHSFFRLDTRTFMPKDRKIKPLEGNRLNTLRALDVLIIDEISMVRADLFDAVDMCMRKSLGEPNLVFGGKQVILVGDIFQIPPVVTERDLPILEAFYKNGYFFFSSKAYRDFEHEIIELNQVYRQTDIQFMKILDAIRIGEFSEKDLQVLNERYEPNMLPQPHVIELTTTNALAEARNRQELEKIYEPIRTFEAIVQGEFEEKLYPTEKTLQLKIVTQVMFIKNHMNGKWANGTIGKVVGFLELPTLREDDDEDILRDAENDVAEVVIQVLLENGETVYVNTVIWEKKNYEYNTQDDDIEEKVLGTFTQYPLKLAWAITMHKSQGLTFEKVCLNFGYGAFAAGQTYVALSRCKTLEGLKLRTKIQPKDIKVDESVVQYYDNYFR